ncbi:MAG: cytochrome P450 [Parasphingorhabdus sp.]|uniref:cytochrome P450 n=1 Tax=Parasphingorhabdus sp. TaxID=2709688 RepID=UPI003001FC46
MMDRQTGSKPIEDFNFLDPAVLDDPFEYYGALHEQAPVYKMPETGMYIVAGYDDLRKVLLDTKTFSNNMDGYGMLQGENWKVHQEILEARGWPDLATLNFTDPPAHTRYRRIADTIFNAKRIAALSGRIEQLCHAMIDRFIERGECEFVSEFAFPLVGTIISEQLGLESDQMAQFKKWGEAIMAPTSRVMTVEELRENADTIVEMQQFIAGKLEERRKEPREDLISALVSARADDGEELNMLELQSLMRQFLSGTYESVVTMISHGMLILLRNPDVMARLRADMSRVPDFVEEALRYDSPVPGLARLVTCDTQVGGVDIPAGSIVMTRYAAANRDPAKFECPHKFDIDRNNKAHLAFGNGPHFCVGRALARRELNMAFTALLTRMSDIELARPLPDIIHIPHVLLRPMKELPIRFTKIDAA